MSLTFEFRCPSTHGRLFGKNVTDHRPTITDGNLLEFACGDCKREAKHRGEPAALVLHRFNCIGELIETEVVPPSGR